MGPEAAQGWDLDEVARGLVRLRVEAGSPSYAAIAASVARARADRGLPGSEQHVGRSTVHDAFRTGRRRLDPQLVGDIAGVLTGDPRAAELWAQRCRAAMGRTDLAMVATARSGLPEETTPFVGRQAQLGAILAAVSGGRRVVLLEGLPGAGKTRVAAAAARRLRADGARVLFLDMRGFHSEYPPVHPSAALAVGLRELGTPGHLVPADHDARRRAWTSALADGRHLVVVDDARDADQVRPLLPADGTTVVLVTSRRRLDDVGRDAARVPVGDLSPAESGALAAALTPDAGVDWDSDDGRALLEMSGRLPLAVSLTAARVAARPGWTLADHVAAARARRDSLRLEDDVEHALGASYDLLPDDTRRALRLLASSPVTGVDAQLAAAVLDLPEPRSAEVLDELTAHHLTRPAPDGTWSLHPLVATFAAARSLDEDRPAEREAALDRTYAFAVAICADARDHVSRAGGFPARPEPAPEAHEWLQRNVENVLTLAARAEALDRPDAVPALADGAAWWLEAVSRYDEALQLHHAALAAARQRSDTAAELRSRLGIGRVQVRLSRWEDARAELGQALEGFSATGDRTRACIALNALAVVHAQLGEIDEAGAAFQQCAELAAANGDDGTLAAALDNTAIIARRQGRLADALAAHDRAREVAERNQDHTLTARSLVNSAALLLDLGDPGGAADRARAGIALAERFEQRTVLAYGHDNLGSAVAALGDHESAREHHTTALGLARETGDRHVEAAALNGLGNDLVAAGSPDAARERYDAAVAVAREIGDDLEHGRALRGLGTVAAEQGDTDAARSCWTEALALLEKVGAPEAAATRELLDRTVSRSS